MEDTARKQEQAAEPEDLGRYEVKSEHVPAEFRKYDFQPVRYERYEGKNDTHYRAELGHHKAVGHSIEGAFKGLCYEYDKVPEV